MQGSHSDWKNGKAFSSQGILNRLEKSGKITQNTGKLREFETNAICYFLVISIWNVYYLLKWIKFSGLIKNTGKVRKFCQFGKGGTVTCWLSTSSMLKCREKRFYLEHVALKIKHLIWTDMKCCMHFSGTTVRRSVCQFLWREVTVRVVNAKNRCDARRLWSRGHGIQ